MSKKSYSYNMNFVILAIIAWEVIFWGLYLLFTYSLGAMSGSNSEQLLYKYPEVFWTILALIPIIGVFIYNAVRNNNVINNLPSRVSESYLRPVSKHEQFFEVLLLQKRNRISNYCYCTAHFW